MNLTISQPEKWIEAFRAEAKRKGMTLAEWIGKSCIKQLPADVRRELPERPPAHRPRKKI